MEAGTEGETSGRGGMAGTGGTRGSEGPSEPGDPFDSLDRLYSNTRRSLWVTVNPAGALWNEGDVGVDTFVLTISEWSGCDEDSLTVARL